MLLKRYEDFCSLKKKDGLFIIPTYNNFSYLKNTISQLNKINVHDIAIIDNNSKYEPMVEYLNEISKDYIVLKNNHNPGPKYIFTNKDIFTSLPEIFYLTDPDLEGFSNFPDNFHDVFMEVSNRFSIPKVGSALNIDVKYDSIIDDINWENIPIRQHESRFYSNLVGKTIDGNNVYAAPIDTTFSMYVKKFMMSYSTNPIWNLTNLSARIGGVYTLDHYGWYRNPPIPEDERKFYLDNIYKNPQYPHAFASVDEVRLKMGMA